MIRASLRRKPLSQCSGLPRSKKLTISRFLLCEKNYKDFVNPLDFPEFSGKMMQEILPKLF